MIGFFLIASIVLSPSLGYAEPVVSGSAGDNILPSYKPVKLPEEYVPLYEKYSVSNYSLNLVELSEPWYVILNSLFSMIFYFMASVAKLTIYILQWSFNLTAFDSLTLPVSDFVRTLQEKLFVSKIFSFVLFLLGIAIIFSLYKGEKDIGNQLVKVIANLIIAFTLMLNIPTLISVLNDLGRTGSTIILSVYGATNPQAKAIENVSTANMALVTIGEEFFRYNLYIPWQLAQFGDYPFTTKTNDKGEPIYSGKDQTLHNETKFYLSKNPMIFSQYEQRRIHTLKNTDGSVARSFLNLVIPKSWEKAPKFPSMTYAGITPRFFITTITLIVGTCYGLLLLILAGTALACHFLMLLLAMFSPLIFLLVAIPSYGQAILLRWFQSMVVFGMYKMIISLLLASFLFLQGISYMTSNVSSWGWGFTMFTQIVIAISIFAFRKQLPQFIPIPGMAAVQATEGMFTNIGKKIASTSTRAGFQSIKASKPMFHKASNSIKQARHNRYNKAQKTAQEKELKRDNFLPADYNEKKGATGLSNPYGKQSDKAEAKVFDEMQKQKLNPYNSSDRNRYQKMQKRKNPETLQDTNEALANITEVSKHFSKNHKKKEKEQEKAKAIKAKEDVHLLYEIEANEKKKKPNGKVNRFRWRRH